MVRKKKKGVDCTLSFPDEATREHFLVWLSNQGEQDYWNDSQNHPDQVCFDYTHPLLKTFNPSRIRAERTSVLENGGDFREENARELIFQHLHKALALCKNQEEKYITLSGSDLSCFDFDLEDLSWDESNQWEVTEAYFSITDLLTLLTQHLETE